LEHIEYQLNGGEPIVISSNIFATKASWALSLTNLVPGANTVRVRSVDLAGNASFDATRYFTYVASSRLQVEVDGAGTVKPNLDGQVLQLAQVYSMKASPGRGQLFAGWTSLHYGTNPVPIRPINPSLRFQMEDGLLLKATFVPNPFLAV